jgi:hypothetical protein
MNYSVRQRRVPLPLPVTQHPPALEEERNLLVLPPRVGLFLERNLNLAGHLHTEKFAKRMKVICIIFCKKVNLNEWNEFEDNKVGAAVLILEKFEGKGRAATPTERREIAGADQMRNAAAAESREK